LFVLNRNGIARALGKLVAHPSSALASDSLYLPKITGNGIPLYDSIDKASSYITANKLIARVAPVLIIGLCPQPALATMTYGLLTYVYYVIML
jgi:hypothetical protein